MPEHWVGRSVSSSRWVPTAAVLLALVVAAGFVQHDSQIASPEGGADAPARLLAKPDSQAESPASLIPNSAVRVALRELELHRVDAGHDHAAGESARPQVSRFGGSSDWETGTLTVPGEDPRVYLYVAKRHDSGEWRVALEGRTDFALLAEQGQMALAGTPSAELLATTATSNASAGGSARLSLPWNAGRTWRLTGGPHHNSGGARPWSSLDFAGPRPGMSVKLRAARGGIVLRPCRNLVQIRHADGWTTSYYHVRRIRVRSGQRVARGALLGHTSTRAGCGGRATGPHLHFAVLHYGRYVNLRGHVIGGWTVREGSSQYRGCMVKGTRKRCAPSGSIYNSGAIGD